MPGKTENAKRSGQAYLTHNLSNNLQEYEIIKQGLENLAQIPDPTDYLGSVPDMTSLISWVIRGQGKVDYFNNNENTLLPDGSLNYCMECYYHIDQILSNSGAGYSGSYDWQGYASSGYNLTPDEGEVIENDICRIYNDCIAYMDEYYFDKKRTVGEECVRIDYNDGTSVTGLYCQVINDTPGPE